MDPPAKRGARVSSGLSGSPVGLQYARAQATCRVRRWWIAGRFRSGRRLRIYWTSNREPRVRHRGRFRFRCRMNRRGTCCLLAGGDERLAAGGGECLTPSVDQDRRRESWCLRLSPVWHSAVGNAASRATDGRCYLKAPYDGRAVEANVARGMSSCKNSRTGVAKVPPQRSPLRA